MTRFVDELEFLHREHAVQFFWFADENPTTDKQVWHALLEEISRRDMGTGMTCSIRSQDIVRDADILDLYRRAGFLYVLMGVETVTDETLQKVHKESSVSDAYQAVRLLRKHGILSIIDYIFGLEEETPGTIWRALRGLHRYDSDFVNALYLTPYSWTATGREMLEREIVEEDLSKWDCRHQVVGREGSLTGTVVRRSEAGGTLVSSPPAPRVAGGDDHATAACAAISASLIGTSSAFSGMKSVSSARSGNQARLTADAGHLSDHADRSPGKYRRKNNCRVEGWL